MKIRLFLFILILSNIIYIYGQNKCNILNIKIQDSVIHLKHKPLKIEFYKNHFLPKYEQKFKIKVSLINNCDSTSFLYYFYNDVFPSYDNYVKFDTSIFLKQIPLPKTDIFDSLRGNVLLYIHMMGFRYVLIDSLTQNVIYQDFGSWTQNWGILTKTYNFIANTSFHFLQFFKNHQKPKFAKPLILKSKKPYTSTYHILVIRRILKSRIIGRKGDLVYPSTVSPEGLPKGTYYLYMYYWVDLRPEVPNIDYVNMIYSIKLKKPYQYYILKDLQKRKEGIPFKGYIKSNTVKVIVE
jgi:hypothetical protein